MKKSLIIKILSIITVICSAFFIATACKSGGGVSSLTINFNVDGANYQTITFTGGEFNPPEDPSKKGHRFDGWYLDENEWDKPFNASFFDGEITVSDLNVYAKFVLNHEHVYEETATNPTCEAQGYVTYTCECGDSYKDNVVDATGHEFRSQTVDPTCDTMGYVRHFCANNCGYSYKTDYVSELGHLFTNYVSNNDATCYADGTKTAICDREDCDEENTITDEGSKIEVEVTFKTLTVNVNTVTANFENNVTSFNFENEITVSDGASFLVCGDKNGTNVLNKVVALSEGSNLFYVFIILDGEAVGVYAVDLCVEKSFTVSFNTKGGSAVSSQKVINGELATLPTETPTLNGYTFKNWDFDFSTPITSDVEINAVWEEKIEFVSFSINENTVKKEYAYGEDFNVLSIEGTINYNHSKYNKKLTYGDFEIEYDNNLTEIGGIHVITVKYYDQLLNEERECYYNVSVEYVFIKTTSVINMFVDDGNDVKDFASLFTVNTQIPLTFISSDNTVLSFNGSMATAKKAGTVTITVKNAENNVSATATVKVYGNAINVESDSYTLVYNQTVQESVDFNVASKFDTLNYTSNNINVAIVENGKIVAKGMGLATITISDPSNVNSVSISVMVVENKDGNFVTVNSLTNPMVNLYGRNQIVSGGVQFEYTVSGFEFKFYGTSAYAELSAVIANGFMPRFQVLVDGEKVDQTEVDNGQNTEKSITSTNGQRILNVNSATKTKYTLVEGLTEGWHTVKVLKRTPARRGDNTMDKAILYSVSVGDGGYIGVAPIKPELKIEVYGDSISCTYGNLHNGDKMQNNDTNGLLGYHYLAAEQLGAEINVQAHSGWGILYDTAQAQNWLWPNYYNKFENGSTPYDMSYDADIIVINLGTNDNTVPNSEGYANFVNDFATKTEAWVKDLLRHNPDAKVLLTYGMMGKGTRIIEGYELAVQNLKAEGYNNVYYYTYEGTYDGSGHPGKADHISNSTYLANKISEILGLSK